MSAEQSASNVVPFGKYKGLTVAEMLSDHAYCEWLVAQDWLTSHPTPVSCR